MASTDFIRRSLGGIFMLFLTALYIPGTGLAAERDELYTVKNVAVDETASNAAEARDRAIKSAQNKALSILARRLVTSEDISRLTSLSSDETALLIEGIDLLEEKLSGVRYIAKLNVRFRPEAVRAMLGQSNVHYSESKAKPVLILPVWQAGNVMRLWDLPNPWFAAWRNHRVETGVLPIEIPLGDIVDLRQMPVTTAVNGNLGALVKMARRYGADSAAVVKASPLGGDEGSILVSIKHYGTVSVIGTDSFSIPIGEDGMEATLIEAAQVTADRLEDGWKRISMVNTGVNQQLRVGMSITGIEDWVALRQRLQGLSMITLVQPLSMTTDYIEANLIYQGELDALEVALARENLQLVPLRDSGFGYHETNYELRPFTHFQPQQQPANDWQSRRINKQSGNVYQSGGYLGTLPPGVQPPGVQPAMPQPDPLPPQNQRPYIPSQQRAY